MDEYGMVTGPAVHDSALVIDGIKYCDRSTWIQAGLSLDNKWADLVVGRIPKSRKELKKAGLILTVREYKATIGMVTNKNGELEEHLGKVFSHTVSPVTFAPKTKDLQEFTYEGEIFKNIVAFTDGSSKDDLAGWGAFFKEGSKYNTYRSVVGSPNNYTAELEAIEYVLGVSPMDYKLTVFTDSLTSVEAIIKALKASPVQLRRMNNADTLWRICQLFNTREGKGNTVCFEHVYSHQASKIKSNPDKWEALIANRNAKLKRKYPTINTREGNEQADALAEKGRKKGIQIPLIPEGMDAYVTTTTKGTVRLADTEVKRLISNKDRTAWNNKAEDLILKGQKKWWDDEASHHVIAEADKGTWLRRARLHNRTTTVLLKQNVSNKKEQPKFKHIAAAVEDEQCPKLGCTERDTQNHIYHCQHSARGLKGISNLVRTCTDKAKQGLRIPRYWLTTAEPPELCRAPKGRNKVAPIHANRKWGSLGFFPKGILNILTQELGRKKGMQTAKEINAIVIGELFKIDQDRVNCIKEIINDQRTTNEDPFWVPP